MIGLYIPDGWYVSYYSYCSENVIFKNSQQMYFNDQNRMRNSFEKNNVFNNIFLNYYFMERIMFSMSFIVRPL